MKSFGIYPKSNAELMMFCPKFLNLMIPIWTFAIYVLYEVYSIAVAPLSVREICLMSFRNG